MAGAEGGSGAILSTHARVTALEAVHPLFRVAENYLGFKLRFGTYRHSPESWPLGRHLHLPLSTLPAALTLRHRLNGSGERPGWHKGDEARRVAQLAGMKVGGDKAFYSNAVRGGDWLFF